MRGRPPRELEKLAIDPGAPRVERRALEEAVSVERGGELEDLRRVDQLAVSPHDRRLDVGDAVLAVEQRDDLEQRHRDHHDRLGVACRISQGEKPLPVVIDREGLA